MKVKTRLFVIEMILVIIAGLILAKHLGKINLHKLFDCTIIISFLYTAGWAGAAAIIRKRDNNE